MFRLSLTAWSLMAVGAIANAVAAEPVAAEPVATDYCSRLQQEVQGKKHGFLAGNLTYYVGGFHASWNLREQPCTLACTATLAESKPEHSSSKH